jgi:menaquinone-dependent protoporphyrinogen IX oxidase
MEFSKGYTAQTHQCVSNIVQSLRQALEVDIAKLKGQVDELKYQQYHQVNDGGLELLSATRTDNEWKNMERMINEYNSALDQCMEHRIQEYSRIIRVLETCYLSLEITT